MDLQKITKLTSPSYCLAFASNQNFCKLCYFGPSSSCPAIFEPISDDGYGKMFSFFGKGDFSTPSLIIENADSSLSNAFLFEGIKIAKDDMFNNPLPLSKHKKESIILTYKDLDNLLLLTIVISSFEDCDVFTISSSLKNISGKEVKIQKFASYQLDIKGHNAVISSYDGMWANERFCHQTRLEGGSFTISSLTGSSGASNNPFFQVQIEDAIYSFNLIYSGNHKESVEVDSKGIIRIQGGLNDEMFSFSLKPGETFYTPEATLLKSLSKDEATFQYHEFINNHILVKRDALAKRVLFNSWEGVFFDFDKEKIISMAKASKEMGAELFVMDDGWFGHRDKENSSLGDWFAYTKKIGSLKELADSVRSLGMDFGIWMEPEMINEDSELFKKHPEYAMRIPHKEPFRQRYQLMLNLTNPEVEKYVFDSICSVIDESKATYLKWDFNRQMTDMYSPLFSGGEYSYRYYLAFYEIMGALIKKYPGVLFEGCASGGGRYDLGILSYFPQIWASDAIDPMIRSKVQAGTLVCYPSRTMCCHVGTDINVITKLSSLIEDRFNVALMGNLGYELNPLTVTKKEKETIIKQIAFYKEIRDFTFSEDSYLLGQAFSSNNSGYCFVNKAKDKALACLICIGDKATYVPLKGLDPNKIYLINKRKVTGSALIKKGIRLNPRISGFNSVNTDKITTKLFIIKEVKERMD